MRLVWLSAAVLSTATALGQSTRVTAVPSAAPAQQPQAAATLASTVDRAIGNIEKLVVDAAEAMPEDKFNFSPEGLSIPGADYKGVRTFAVQARHVAASNYFLWSSVTGDKIPDAYYRKGVALQSLKDLAGARDAFEHAVKADPSGENGVVGRLAKQRLDQLKR